MFLERIEREDIVHFLNACHACTGQREFYETRSHQRVSIEFLHEYMRVNYRSIYARSLAAGINHFNQSQIVIRLLATGRDAVPAEGRLIARALETMPPQRAWRTLLDTCQIGVNNRRTRAIVRDFIRGRDLPFDCVKYGGKVAVVVAHTHLRLPGEAGEFLFRRDAPGYSTPIFELMRRARFDREAVYRLPFTVAEGLAARHGIARETFLRRIEPMLTQAERLRLQRSAEVEIDLARAPLTKLALFLLSVPDPPEDPQALMQRAAEETLRQSPLSLGRVAAVLDNSYSSSGTAEKRRRPLAIAWGVDRLLAAAAREYRPFWTHPWQGSRPIARGATDLASPMLTALETDPDLLVVISDAVDNDPPGGGSAVARLWRRRVDPRNRIPIIHLNPVFIARDYAPRGLDPTVPTVGIRSAEDLPTALEFARFATGSATRAALERYLERRVAHWLSTSPGPEDGSVR